MTHSGMIVSIFALFAFAFPAAQGTPGSAKTLKEWCDTVLGCLNITDDWYTITRPINVLPATRPKINTRFYLHTRAEPNNDTDYIINADELSSLKESPFDATKPTKFVVHGFVDDGTKEWVKLLAQLLLDHGDYNVIRVDWGDGSKPMYFQATANTRVVGLEIAHLVNRLVTTYGLDPSQVHCIGHSLGAHTCGYAGEKIEKMGRISGMDPAGPYFTGSASFVHLDPTDALFVDNIHSDAQTILLLGYGTAQPMGNIDFYPNSGLNQPGCDPVNIAIDAITSEMLDAGEIFACNHHRAINYFTDSLRSPDCKWLAHECKDYETFQNGQCYSCDSDNKKCAYSGIDADQYADKSRQFVTFYYETDKKEPFCMNHYELRILTDSPLGAKDWVMGRLYATLYGDNAEIISSTQITKNHQKIDQGQVVTAMFATHQNVDHTVRVELKWVYDDSILEPGLMCLPFVCNKSLYVKSVQVSAINNYPESDRLKHTSLVCSVGGSTTQIKDGTTSSFLTGTKCSSIP